MTLKTVFCAGAFFAAATLSAASQSNDIHSANYYHRGCIAFLADSPKDLLLQGACAGIVSTLFNLNDELPTYIRFCPPKGSTVGQAIRVVVTYLDNNPARLHESFILLSAEGLRKAWPCR
jgi:hypothetical protein